MEKKLFDLRNWLAQSETKSGGTLEMTRTGAAPMSVSDRIQGARQALQSRQVNHQKRRTDDFKGSVELYWLSKWMDAQLNLMWAKLEDWELTRRLELHRWLLKKFMQILPEHVAQSYRKSLASPGQLALNYTESRSFSSQLTKHLVELFETERISQSELENIMVAQENLTAAGTLSEAELVFLYEMLKARRSSVEGTETLSQRAKNLDLAHFYESREQCELLHEESASLHQSLEQVKHQIKHAIDLAEIKGSTSEALRLFQSTKEICEQNAPHI